MIYGNLNNPKKCDYVIVGSVVGLLYHGYASVAWVYYCSLGLIPTAGKNDICILYCEVLSSHMVMENQQVVSLLKQNSQAI